MDPRCAPSSNESGQALPLVVAFVLVLMIMCGAVIDIGNAYRVHQQMQASADAAAAAGAGNLPSTAAAITAATKFSCGNGRQEPDRRRRHSVGIRHRRLLDQSGLLQPGQHRARDPGRDVPTTFLRVIGIDTIPETVHAQACSPCGGLPLDVMIVLDRSGSMSGHEADIRQGRHPGVPGLDGSGPGQRRPGRAAAGRRSRQRLRASASGNYNLASAAYVLVPLNNTYASRGQPQPELPAALDAQLRAGRRPDRVCSALDAAQAEIDADGRAGTQKVIIILSDGAANTGPNYLPNTSPYRTRPCGQAVNVATGE